MLLKDINQALLIWGIIPDDRLLQIKKQGRLVIVPENRPWMIGLKHNIPLLKGAGIDFVYCTDNMPGLLFNRQKITSTLLFCRQLKDEGIIGPCGSLYVALLSRLHQVPVEVIKEGDLSFDPPDTDASSLCGKPYVADQDKADSVVMANDEFIEWEILK